MNATPARWFLALFALSTSAPGADELPYGDWHDDAEPYGEWNEDEPFGPPPERVPLPEQAPTLPGPASPRHQLALGLSAGVAYKLCVSEVDRCSNAPGPSLELHGAVRPLPTFSWGVAMTRATFEEAVTVADASLFLDVTATSVRLFGRVLPIEHGPVDPYVELAAGGGWFGQQGVTRTGSQQPLGIDGTLTAPLLHAGAGLDLRVTSQLSLGAHFRWTHWLLARHERCYGVAFGACTLPSYGHFDVDNAVLGLELGATFLFGRRH